MSWQNPRERLSLITNLAIQKATVSRKLAELREAHAGENGKALSQEKAAGRVGVTVRQWQRWEAGQSLPFPRNLGAIADTFGFSVDEFYDDEPVQNHRPPTQLDRIEETLNLILAALGGRAAALDGISRAAEELGELPPRKPPSAAEPSQAPAGQAHRPANG